MIDNYYKILGLNENSTQQEIKSAYKKLAILYHPDKTGGNKIAEEKFKLVNNAYQILSDPQQRAQYDLLRNYYQFQATTTYTDFNNSTYSKSYKNAYYQRTHNQYAKNYKGYDRQKAEKEGIAIGSILIFTLLAIVGIYMAINIYLKERLIEKLAEQRKIQLEIVEDYYKKEDFRATLIEIDTLIAGQPSDDEFRGIREEVISELNKRAEASFQKADYQKALKYYLILGDFETIFETEFEYKVALCYKKQNQFDKAIEKLKILINKEPEDFRAWCEIGNIFFYKKQNFEEALPYYDHSKKLVISFYERRYGKAYPMIIEPSNLNKIHFDIFFGRASLNSQLGNLEDAIRDCSWASFLRPKNADVWLLKADCEQKLGNIQNACSNWEEVYSFEPDLVKSTMGKYCR
ncbi:MAG: DnaJ domain-containing protein [Flammeovirgaceae bacterium]|nr:DnaJ domain-containing protein [Flammeovirgaceae bacterium]